MFEERLKEIFGSSFRSYSENKRDKTVSFKVEDFTAEKLFAASDTLGTGTIRVESFYSRGCDTCDYGSDQGMDMYAINVKFV